MRWWSRFVWLGVLELGAGLVSREAAAAAPPTKLSSPIVNGIYAVASNRMRLQMLSSSQLRVELETQSAGPTPDTGFLAGEASIKGNLAVYDNSQFGRCVLTFTFTAPGRVSVAMDGDTGSCGLGHRAAPDGQYVSKAGVPVFPTAEEAMSSNVKPLIVVPTKLEPNTFGELEQVVSVVDLELRESRDLAQVASGAERAAKQKADERKPLLDALKTLRTEHDKHQKAGAAAQSAYKSGVKAGKVAPAALEKLKLAHEELGQAYQAAKAILNKTAELRRLETELGKQLALASEAAPIADAIAKDATKNATLVKGVAAVLERAKGQDKSTKALKAADSALASAARAKAAAAEATSSAANAKSAQLVVTKAAGAATLATWVTARQRTQADDNRQAEKLDKTRRAFEQVALAAKQPGAPLPMCNFRAQDWENRRYSPTLVLRRGVFERGKIEKGTYEQYRLGGVNYADTDGDGLLEAFVGVGYSNGAPLGDSAITYVFEPDESCQPLPRGELVGEGVVKNNRYVVELPVWQEGDATCCPSGSSHSEYKLVGDAPGDARR